MTDQAKAAPLREIWLLDDDRGVRFVLAEALRDAGLAVREFGDVAAARAALQTARPALLLTDVRMPGEDGLNLLGELWDGGTGEPNHSLLHTQFPGLCQHTPSPGAGSSAR